MSLKSCDACGACSAAGMLIPAQHVLYLIPRASRHWVCMPLSKGKRVFATHGKEASESMSSRMLMASVMAKERSKNT